MIARYCLKCETHKSRKVGALQPIPKGSCNETPLPYYASLLLRRASLAVALTGPVNAIPTGSALQTIEDARQGDGAKRKKKRVKGGSGRDDVRDILEYSECR